MRPLLPVVGAVCLAACGEPVVSDSRHVEVELSGWGDWARDDLRIAAGRGWVLAEAAPTFPASRGEAKIPAELPALALFLDVDGDERLTPFAEPSAICGRSRCVLTPTQLYVHRIRTIGHDVGDQLVAVAQQFEPTTGTPDSSTRLCGDDGSCVSQSTGPYEDLETGALMLEACPGSEMTLATARGEQKHVVRQPAKLDLDLFATREADGGIRIEVVADRPIDRFFARIERSDGSPTDWTSEFAGSQLSLLDRNARLRVPPATIRACADCRLRVQVVAAELSGSYPLFSETRVAVQLADVR